MNPSCILKRLAPLGLLVFAAALQASDVALTNGQNAENVVGQTDAGGAAVFNEGTPYDSQRLEGFNLPIDVEVDTASHRLFVCDYYSSRILEYDLDSSNVLVDRTADHVLGQTSFYGNIDATAANRMKTPAGIEFDPSSNRLFVGDYLNNRVLIFDVASITDGENAVNVLGQANFTSLTAATSINGMRSPEDAAYDAANKRLFVSDADNSRVLVFDLTTTTDGENAVNVLGQTSFTAGSSSTSISGLSYPRHVDYDPVNSRLFVADYSNSRVMVFDVASITDGENAVNVLGQSNFTTSTSATAINRMNTPFGVAYSTATQRLFVGDFGNNRVIIFDLAVITDGENAVNVLGQTTFTSNTSQVTQSGMSYLRGVALDDASNRLYLADFYNNRITMFDVSPGTIANGENAENVVGQTDGGGGGVYTTWGVHDGAAQKGADLPYDVALDTTSHRLFLADYLANRVLVYNLDASNTLVDRTVDNELGQPDFFRVLAQEAAQNRTVGALGLAFDPARNYLFVTNYIRHRVTVFDVASITDGENAVYVLGQANFTGGNQATTASGMYNPAGLDYDVATQKLFVADRYNHRVTVFDMASITNGENAVNVLGQADFTTNTVATPPTAASLDYPWAVKVNGNRLFVADETNQRVLVFDVASITDGESAVNVLGQATFTTRTTGTSAGTLKYPRGLALDSAGNRLFVSDDNNNRINVYNVTSITDGENASYELGQGNFTSGGSSTSQSGLYYPKGLAYDPGMNRLYISDSYNNRVIVQSVGPVAPATSTVSAVTGTGAGSINLSWASAGDDGVFNNLTGYYRIQYATYTAVWSTSSTPTNAYTSTVTATNVVPGVVQSTTIAGLTPGVTYYFALFTADEVPNWSSVSNTTSAVAQSGITLSEAVGQPGWIGQGETQRILGTAQVVSDISSGVTVSSVAVTATGYTADGNLTNVEVWVSSSGYIDANAIRLEGTAKAFSSNTAVFTQNVTVSTTPLYFIARADVSGSATAGTVDMALQIYTTAATANNPIAFSNATDIVAPPSGSPSGLSATASGNLLQVNLSWGAAAGADTYSIYRATYSGVTTTDFLLGITNTTSFADDYIPPNQLMYYKVVATNRAGSTASGSASATSVDVPALTTSNVYLRAGFPGAFGDGAMAKNETLNVPFATDIDRNGNVYIADQNNHRIRFVPKTSGTYFGQSMTANYIYTIAGNGTGGYVADNVAATSTKINYPTSVTVDASGNVFIADAWNSRIRFIPKIGGSYFGQSMTANYIYTIAGTGTAGYVADNVAATSAQMNYPYAVAVDPSGNLYVADHSNHRIRFIPKTSGTYYGQSMTGNYVYTIAGNGTGGYVADNVAATSTQINIPYAIQVDVGGNIYFAERNNHRIRFVAKTSGTYFGQSMTANCIYTIAGTGTAGYGASNVAATSSMIDSPTGVSVDYSGNVYMVDYNNHRIRFIAKTSGTYFGQSMTANYIYTIAGNGSVGYGEDGVAATSAVITNPTGVSVDNSGNVYVAGNTNLRVRFIPRVTGTYFGQSMTANYIYTVAGGGRGAYNGDNIIGTSALLYTAQGITVDGSGNIYIADTKNHRIRFIPKVSGTYFGHSMTANYIYSIAGTGAAGNSGNGGPASAASVNWPYDACVDSGGNVIMADQNGNRIRFIPRMDGTYFGQAMNANYIYAIAGDGTASHGGDGGIATSGQINSPTGVVVDSEGNLVIAEYGAHYVRFVPRVSGTYYGQSMTANDIYTIAGNGSGGYNGDNQAATAASLYNPFNVATDADNNIYIADYNNQRVRFIPRINGTYFGQSLTANLIYTIAGNGSLGYLGDSVLATSTRIKYPSGVSVDAGGNVYISDSGNYRIRFIPKKNGTYFGQSRTADYIYTIAGTGTAAYNGENAAATGKNIYNPIDVFASPDHMVYLTDNNNKIRMIAGEDFIAPSTSTLAVTTGLEEATLSWASAGDDNVNLGNLTGTYRIQYATYSAVWSTASTPANAITVTISTTNAVPGSAQSYTATGLTAGLTYYFVLWTGDEVPNWSDISNATSTIPLAPIRSMTITYGNTQAFGVGMMGTTLVGSTGTIVTNDGTLASTYALRASTATAGTPWSIKNSTPAGPDQLVIYGVFHGAAAPVETDFGLEDVIETVNQACSNTKYTVSGSTTGVSVPAGQDRTLWIRMDMPTRTTTMAPQSMKVEITAEPP